GLARFAVRERHACGQKTVVVAKHPAALAIAAAIEEAGGKVALVVDLTGELTPSKREVLRAELIEEARGGKRVEKLVVNAGGKKRALPCDAVALCGSTSSAFELASQAGCDLVPHSSSGGLPARADAG